MKSFELLPTEKNLIDSFLNDTIGRDEEVVNFAEILSIIDGNNSIAIDGAWGAGKTFFLKQVNLLLDTYNLNSNIAEDKKSKIKQFCKNKFNVKDETFLSQINFYYDAWQHDNDEDPIFSLVYNMIKVFKDDYKYFPKQREIFSAAIDILDFFKGTNITQVLKKLKGISTFEELEIEEDIHKKLDLYISSILEETGDRLNIFIDELDRCNPVFAVKLLERIKHYFTDNRVSIIFAINTNELVHTIKKFYGNDFDAYRYLDRFFSFRQSLLPLTYEKLMISFNDVDEVGTSIAMCSIIIDEYQFSIRETLRYIQSIKSTILPIIIKYSNKWHPFAETYLFLLRFVAPIILGLKIFDKYKYDNFVNGNDGKPLLTISKKLPKFYFNCLLKENEVFDIKEKNKTMKYFDTTIQDVYDTLFNYQNNETRNYKIGKIVFDNNTKSEFMKKLNLQADFINKQAEE